MCEMTVTLCASYVALRGEARRSAAPRSAAPQIVDRQRRWVPTVGILPFCRDEVPTYG